MLCNSSEAPRQLIHTDFTARPLSLRNFELDYAAYTASPDVIRRHSDGLWPVEGFTLAKDRELVEKHEADHKAGRAFTFVLLDPNEEESLGCLYLNPLADYLDRVGAQPVIRESYGPASAMVTFWLRQDLESADRARTVAEAVDGWIRDEWPLDAHVFRVLPTERCSVTGLQAAGFDLLALSLPGQHSGYLWFSRTHTTHGKTEEPAPLP